MKYLLLCMSVILFNGLHAIDNYSSNETLNVLAISGLKFRDKPEGNVLQTIPYGSKVVTLEPKNYDYLKTVEGIKGAWVKVNFNGNFGYVFDGFLSSLPAPNLSDENLGVYVKREFRAISNEIPLSFLKDNELGESGSNVLFLEWKNQKCAYEESFYYEGGGESLCIPGVSMEEAYLLMRIIERETFKETLELLINENTDKRPYSQFVLNGISYQTSENGSGTENRDFYTCELYMGCEYRLTIVKHNGYVIINIGGGC